jgi:hypothetical protein
MTASSLLNAACPAALTLLRVTTAVIELGPRVKAGDEGALQQLDALAAVLPARTE